MAVRDIEAFVREQAVLFDPNMDVTPGSPFDTRVIQPIVRRLGTDPFTVDMTTFINDRLVQAYPDLATKEGDALTDLLNKPASLLWDPVVREIRRVARNLSFQDPTVLTLDEADALGANFFRERRKGNLAKGPARVYVAQPQNLAISPVNFVTSKGGLHFFPSEIQSIRTEEIILNVGTDGLYYFDFNVVAEKSGTAYNIGPNELVSIANVPAVVKVANLRRYSQGENEETASDYIGRLQREIGEKSLVTLRGIAAKLLDSFPEVSRLNVVGFNDPEMQRDIIRGGGLGSIVGSGVAGATVPDGEGKPFTRRFTQSEEDFLALISGDPTSWVLTVFEAFGGTVLTRDLPVLRVINATDLDVADQVMLLGASSLYWTLRKRAITLSAIPGGILFPDSENGTVDIPDDEIHIGGSFDVHVRGSDFDEATLVLDSVTDDRPLLGGSRLVIGSGSVTLQDLLEGTDYEENDETWRVLEDADVFTYALQILEGVDAGAYRITRVTQTVGAYPSLKLDPEPTNPGATEYRWKLFDEINIDLVEPKETRYGGEDLRTLQGVDIVDTAGGINFNDYGVAEGDTLRILNGPDAGDYALVADPIAPSYEQLQLDTPMTQSQSDLEFVIFRPNAGGGVNLPLIRVKSVEILDSSAQPIGSQVPYAKPVDIQSRAFQNPARGVKWDLTDVILGLVSRETIGGTFAINNGDTLIFKVGRASGGWWDQTVTFVGGPLTLADTISQINAEMALWGYPEAAIMVGTLRFGMRPIKRGVQLIGGTAMTAVFGSSEYRTCYDVRSATVTAEGGWDSLDPAVDYQTRLDVLQVTDGHNVGFFEAPYLVNYDVSARFGGVSVSSALMVGQDLVDVPTYVSGVTTDFQGAGFSPEIRRHVQLGARSIGSARLYFLAPTSFEVDPETRFSLETEDGTLNFLPDPTLTYQRIPALPAGDQPGDGVIYDLGTRIISASSDFVRSGIKRGDKVEVTTIPIEGTATIGTSVASLRGKTFIFSLDDGPDRTLTFIRDDLSLPTDDVSRAGVVAQMNAIAGEDIVELTSGNNLRFTTERKIIVRGAGTANTDILADVANTSPTETFVGVDQDNLSPQAGTYTVQTVAPTYETELDLEETLPSTAPYASPLGEQRFRVLRQGLQRIVATDMENNTAEAGLYYFDVELISEGTGDAWNIDAEQQLTAVRYRSDGFYLTTDDENLTFSPVELPKMVLSRSILESGVDDDPANATQLTGQSLQIIYDRAAIVSDIQNFVSSETERVVCASPLGRHLIPHFVRFDMTYVGGSKESVVVPEVEQYIRNLYPSDELESSDLQKIVLDRGATSIDNPIDIIAVVHYTDRTVYVSRSQDALTTGRLAAFIPDVLNIVRNTV